MSDKIPCNLRMEAGIVERMDDLCRLAGCRRVELVESLIAAEYDRVNGNPQLKAILEQLRTVADSIRQMSAIDSDAPQ